VIPPNTSSDNTYNSEE